MIIPEEAKPAELVYSNPGIEANPESPPPGPGAIYVAFNYDYLLMAAYSATTAKRVTPGLEVAVITNVPLRLDNAHLAPFDYIYFTDVDTKYNRIYKLTAHRYAPWEKAVFIDCDTEVQRDLSPAWEIMGHHDVAVRQLDYPARKDYPVLGELSSLYAPVWNSGVIFFRRTPGAIRLFDAWMEHYFYLSIHVDQPSLARTIINTPEVRVLSLNAYWNAKPGPMRRYSNQSERSPAIYHYCKPENDRRIVSQLSAMDSAIGSLVEDGAEVQAVRRKYRVLRAIPYLGRPFIQRYLKRLEILVRKLSRGRVIIGMSRQSFKKDMKKDFKSTKSRSESTGNSNGD